ncbi:hypothetical protein M422DRAFT_56591 [Sphaerobolus stellatus SS14]|uniref:HNH nuclease domain-containing protein n=1 Tax=Sphaerobolus stellatus (strain SS14) TaxID=990650 RepID=A0A0C9U4G7_SPHS4|nr:hypothetical protein M422DRAFT_56591 [Sphaerobolus stellatus SS14]
MAYSSGSEYDPRLEDATSFGVADTLLLRVPRDVQISQSARTRVQSADPNQGRCLIENCAEYRCVEFCHCFPSSQRKDLIWLTRRKLSNIEWHWNMQKYTLNLDTRRNIFRAGAAMHGLHAKNAWLLLPEEHIINKYHETVKDTIDGPIAERQSFPNIPDQNDFEYRFVPLLPAMKTIAIHRQLGTQAADSELMPNDFVTYIHPFNAMPKLTSHLHPKFAILEAGRKLGVIAPPFLLEVVAEYPILQKALVIYAAWTCQCPADAQNDPSYNPPDNHDGDDDDDGNNGGDNDADSAVRTIPD